MTADCRLLNGDFGTPPSCWQPLGGSVPPENYSMLFSSAAQGQTDIFFGTVILLSALSRARRREFVTCVSWFDFSLQQFRQLTDSRRNAPRLHGAMRAPMSALGQQVSRMNIATDPKRLEILHETVPSANRDRLSGEPNQPTFWIAGPANTKFRPLTRSQASNRERKHRPGPGNCLRHDGASRSRCALRCRRPVHERHARTNRQSGGKARPSHDE